MSFGLKKNVKYKFTNTDLDSLNLDFTNPKIMDKTLDSTQWVAETYTLLVSKI